MHKDEKEKVVAELTERLQASQSLLVADYRGLTMSAIDDLRGELLKHGARFSVVKNTLTRRAATDAMSSLTTSTFCAGMLTRSSLPTSSPQISASSGCLCNRCRGNSRSPGCA